MEEITNIQEVSPITFEVQSYSSEVTNLISSVDVETQFSPETDYLEYYVYDLNGNIVYANFFGFPNYTILDNQLAINPEQDIKDTGFGDGQYNTLYNFLSNELGSNGSTLYYISEISTDRTEVRLASTDLTRLEIISFTTAFIEQQSIRTEAYPDFYLNFGNNQLIIANNVLLDDSNFENPTVLIKLYEPLPTDFTVNTTLWVVKTIAESKAYNINTTTVFDILDQNIALKGPNTNLSIKDQINNSTEYGTHASLSQTTSSQGSGSLQYQINSLLANKGIKINIDYSDYNQFINFSSAQTRLENFYYKLSLIEEYNTSASLSDNTTTNYYVSSSNVVYQNKIDDLITNFDGYEYHLYYTSGSTSWPKTNSTFPYINAETTSTPGQNFLVSQSAVAEAFDKENNDALINSVPSYLREDPANAPYELFVEMVGQNYDSVWVYLKDVTNKFDADNRLNYGISKDLIAQAIRDLGVNIYQNNFSTGDLYSALLGITPSGSLFNLPNTTGSLPTPSGYEFIDTYITASATGSLYPVDDINKSIYKRIYHNLPYLLKKKGTVAGLKSIISLYGIPDTILRVNEFGGKDIDDSNDYDFWQNQYDYKFDTNEDGDISSNWGLKPEWQSEDNVPSNIQLRFKMPSLDAGISQPLQSIWSLDNGDNVALTLEYTGSGYTSGSYSGSIPNPENQYATLKFTPDNFASEASVYLPFFDSGWWSVMVERRAEQFTLYAANKIYTGEEGSSIGFIASSSLITANTTPWVSATNSYFPSNTRQDINIGGGTYTPLSGSYQEIRYFTTELSASVFSDYTMNPNSIEGSSVYQSANQLAFRASLGGELYTGSTSIHPKVTGSSITQSFTSNSNFTINGGGFTSNEEYVYLDQFPAGIKNRVSDKIKQSSIVLPYTGSLSNTIPNTTLSPFIRTQQNSYASESYTHDLDYVEVAFSPQNEINDDIIGSIGYLNIGEYIGDPRQVSSSSETYPQWNTLRDEYFAKYKNEYNIFDYVRLIKYLDNSLFKMLQDFVPARTALAAGVVVKQHLLERNKYPVPQLNTLTTTSYQQLNDPFVFQNIEVTGSPIQMYTITGSNGGSMPELNGEVSGSGPGFGISPITQSWTGSTPSLLGAVPFTDQTQEEFFDGELSGSEFVVTNGELNTECDPFKTPSTTETNYSASFYTASSWPTAHQYATTNGRFLLWWDFDTFEYETVDNTGSGGGIAYNKNYYYIIRQIAISDTTVDGTNLNNIIPQSINIGLPFIDFDSSNVSLDGTWNATYSTVEVVGGPNINITRATIQENRVNPTAGTDSYFLMNVLESNIQIKVVQNLFGGNTQGNFPLVTPELGLTSPNQWALNSVVSIEPFVPTSFPISDCNVILNNAPLNRVSNRYFDVDYSSNAVTAINERAILNGTAPKANVQNSNYTLLRQISPRYLGTKNTSATTNAIQDDGLASIDHTTAFFLYTPGGNYNTIADRSGSGLYKIGFMIDELGNTYEPQESESAYLPNLYSGFGRDSKVTFVPTATGSDIVGTFPVYSPATKIKPIIYSDTGSLLTDSYLVSGTYPTIDFFPNPNVVKENGLNVNNQGAAQAVSQGNNDTINFTNVVTDEAGIYDTSTSTYTFTEDLDYIVNFKVSASIDPDWIANNSGSIWLRLLSGSTVIAQDQITVTTFDPISQGNVGVSWKPQKDDVFKATLFNDTNEDILINAFQGTTSLNTKWMITPLEGTIGSVPTVGSFTTGQTIDHVLTASQAFAKYYGGSYVQANIPDSGFQFPIEWDLKINDQIRWNGTENLVSEITSITSSISNSITQTYNLYIHLANPIDKTQIDLDYYVFRRDVFQKNTIIIDGPGAVMQPGFILPEYQSPLLKENLSSIIQNLTSNGLISRT